LTGSPGPSASPDKGQLNKAAIARVQGDGWLVDQDRVRMTQPQCAAGLKRGDGNG
jgi:hypothetical protein